MPNFFSVNSAPVNQKATQFSVGEFPGGVVLEIEQTLYNNADAQIFLEFDQTVEYSGTAEGNVIDFAQAVLAQAASQVCIEIEQTVINQADIGKCFVSDWNLVLTINGAEIPHSQIINRMEVTRTENDASIFSFELKPGVGVQDPCEYQGKRVTLDVIQGTTITRVYTGIIDYPTYELVGERVAYKATDRRRELINSQLKTAVKSIGYYTEAMFGEPEDTVDELDKRLTTVPLSVDFDAYGNYTVVDLLPKQVPDYLITSDEIFRRNPRVEIASRARLINKFTFNLDYRYSRLHQRVLGFNWEHSAKNNICLFLQDRYSLTSKAMVSAAAGSAGWDLVGNINFDEVWNGGWYNCGSGRIGWSPLRLINGNTVKRTDSFGDTITDSNGNETYSVEGGAFQDTGTLFCLGASWAASKRWSQTLEEKYSVTIEAPQSINKFGVIEQERNYGVSSNYDDDEFENIDGYDVRWGKLEPFVKQAPNGQGVYIDYTDNRSEFNESFLVATNIGKTTIITSHRDNRVTLEVPLTPEYDLKHTIEVNSNKVICRGKVSKVTHKFDINNREASTEVELSLSRAPGSASDSNITIPGIPNIASQAMVPIGLGNHFGEDPSQPQAANWTGMIGNRLRTEAAGGGGTNFFITNYPESFVVRTPDVPDSLRNTAEGTANASYTMSIQNDPFEIIFTGDCA
jgi:hypothetical protein